MTKKKFQVTNVFLPFVYMFLIFISLPFGTIAGYGLKKLSCTFLIGELKVCTNTNMYDNYYAILDLVIFILPIWLLIIITWSYVVKKLHKK